MAAFGFDTGRTNSREPFRSRRHDRASRHSYLAGRIGGKLKPDDIAHFYPEAVGALEPESLKDLGEEYLKLASAHRTMSRRYFIDKMPDNFQHAGLIHLILPKAKIIDARRHPIVGKRLLGGAALRLDQAPEPVTRRDIP
ncbi:MAG: sulfotransferase [Rhizomicrobium sp.]